MNVPKIIEEFRPQLGLILGSGLGSFAEDRLEVTFRLSYGELPGFPVSTVPGHVGQFVGGEFDGKRIICMQGRFHLYEGYSPQAVTLPIRLMQAAGVKELIATNAAGGINPNYAAGDFMMLEDHINFMATNPLIVDSSTEGIHFPDMSTVYDAEWRERLRDWATAKELPLHEGVYLATTGPSFETPAEIRAFAALGADAVGMSTVPEAIVATTLGLRILGISCITNLAAGISDSPLTHEEVGKTADRVRGRFADLLEAAISFC